MATEVLINMDNQQLDFDIEEAKKALEQVKRTKERNKINREVYIKKHPEKAREWSLNYYYRHKDEINRKNREKNRLKK